MVACWEVGVSEKQKAVVASQRAARLVRLDLREHVPRRHFVALFLVPARDVALRNRRVSKMSFRCRRSLRACDIVGDSDGMGTAECGGYAARGRVSRRGRKRARRATHEQQRSPSPATPTAAAWARAAPLRVPHTAAPVAEQKRSAAAGERLDGTPSRCTRASRKQTSESRTSGVLLQKFKLSSRGLVYVPSCSKLLLKSRNPNGNSGNCPLELDTRVGIVPR